ncbi:MAG: methyltransferase domain-containing protein, partial [Candidatus Hydrogenedentes bacterium]|nr:methyltransferase domain-containing protein [Candidatus Hydrogenedentota bacterium]
GVHHIDTDLIQDTRLLPDPCDLVCLCEVIEHLTGDLVPVFARLSRWVAPDGYLYVTTPNLRSISGLAGLVRHGSGLASKCHETVRQQYERAEGEGGYFGHVREYTAKEVVDFICSFGFGHVASAYQFHPRAETLDRKLIQAMERMLPPWRLFGKHLFRKTG